MNSINNMICPKNITQTKVYHCANIENIFPKYNYFAIKLYDKAIINYGISIIKNKKHISLKRTIKKTSNDSYNIYFFKRISITQYGSILTECNNYISIRGGCRCRKELQNISYTKKKISSYHLVFQITQYLGSAIYHSIINCLTKIIPIMKTMLYLSYSKLHIHYNSAIVNYLSLLGVDKSKLVNGNIYSHYVIIMERVDCTSTIYSNSVNDLRHMLLNRIITKKENNLKKKSIVYKKNIF